MTVPSAVVEALGARSATIPAPPRASRAVRRGDLRLIVPPYDLVGEPRLGLVLRVDSSLQFTEIALVHPYPELATSMDGVVPRDFASTPYDIVVQTDLRGVVWTAVQVSDLVGQLSDETLEEISDLVEGGRPESPTGIRVGTQLGGPQDRRWSLKASEGKALDALTSDCSSEVIDGMSPWVLDRELAIPELLSSCADLDSVILELGHWLSTRDLRMPVDDALELEEIGALDFDVWERADFGVDLYEALLEVIEETLTSATTSTLAELTAKRVIAPYSDRRTSAEEEEGVVYVMGTIVGSAA